MKESEWRPSASREVLVERARLLAKIRAFFAKRDTLEVDTPVLSQATASEPGLQSFSLKQQPTRRLITSPEYAMKRLLASGSGPIYRLGPAFRADEAGRWHNPEFCMLEWYRPGADYHGLMDEVEALIRVIVAKPPEKIDRRSVAEVFHQVVELDPHIASITALKSAAEKRGWAPTSTLNDDSQQAREFWLDLILGIGVAEMLSDAGACFIYDYPACMAMLTQTRPGTPPIAERFELYWRGVELANGGNELIDAKLVAQRFTDDQEQRRVDGLDVQVGDARLVAAHLHGVPACAGVALGVDRLLALALGFDSIAPVLPFSWEVA